MTSEPSHKGISLTIFPTSWAFGPWNLPHKWLFAFGPLRFVYHKGVQGEYGGNNSVHVSSRYYS